MALRTGAGLEPGGADLLSAIAPDGKCRRKSQNANPKFQTDSNQQIPKEFAAESVSLNIETWGFLGIWNFASMGGSVSKMTHAGENHRYVALVRRRNYLLIAH